LRKSIFLVVLVAVVIAVAATAAFGQVPDSRKSKARVVGSAHDFRSNTDITWTGYNVYAVCSICHTAHQPPNANAIDPLWNHELSAVATYGVYGSDTLDAIPQELGNMTTTSNLCLSCHDGTVGINETYGVMGNLDQTTPVPLTHSIPGSPSNGPGLQDDHPVNFVYDATLANTDGGVVIPYSLKWVDAGQNLPLYNGYMQCTTCHDAHNGNSGVFLRQTNTGTDTICLDCHA